MKPAANPKTSRYGADALQLHREQPPKHLWSGAFGEAWRLVKAKPVETLLLSFVWLFFNGGSGCNIPSGGGRSSEQDFDWSTRTDYGPAILDAIRDFFERVSALEVALLGGIIAFVVALVILGVVVGTLVRGGATIFWLRHVRGQDSSLSHTTAVIHFFIPLLISSIFAGLAIMVGTVALIVPGIILALGLSWVTQVVVDKNLSWSESIRASWRLTYGYKLDLLVFWVLCGLLNFLGLLACGVGVIATNAVVMGASVIVYDRVAAPGNAYLDERPAAAPAPEPEPESRAESESESEPEEGAW